MLRNALTIILGIAIAIWIGSLFMWAGVAIVLSIACAIIRQWELASLFALGCIAWGFSAVFFAILPFSKTHTEDVTCDGDVNDPKLERRAAAVFGTVSGTGFGLAVGLVFAVSRSFVVSPEYFPLGLMFSIIVTCTLVCYIMPFLGPEILSALEKAV